MADHDHVEVMTGIHKKPGVSYTALVHSMKGFAAVLVAGVREIAVFSSASETFSNKNTNCPVTERLARFDAVYMAAQANGVRVRGYISRVLDCP
jgi:hydroxymethylglutaryl-CoA lyase